MYIREGEERGVLVPIFSLKSQTGWGTQLLWGAVLVGGGHSFSLVHSSLLIRDSRVQGQGHRLWGRQVSVPGGISSLLMPKASK